MGKSIRSKIKRSHRTEFRQTIGESAAQSFMSTTQAKMNECMNKGGMNSIAQLSKMLNPSDDDDDNNNSEGKSNNEMDIGTDIPNKSNKTLPVKVNRRSKVRIECAVGQDGAKFARKLVSKANKRGQKLNGMKAVQRKPNVRFQKKKK